MGRYYLALHGVFMKISPFIPFLFTGVPLSNSPPFMAHHAHTNVVSQENMVIDSLDGPVTKDEIQSFISYTQTLNPVPTNENNEWVQGHSGENLKAMALVYEIAPKKEILNKTVSFCDTLLSIRNDLSGKRVIWTGRVDPVWPNQPNANPIQTGGEQGDPVGHLATCAKQILQTCAIYNKVVPDGNPHHFGKTYLERAKRYVIEADKTVDQHILKSLLTLRNGKHMYFSNTSPYKTGLPVPWNQQMMLNYGFMNLAQAHELLNDAPERVKLYDQIVKFNIDWFFKDGVSLYTDKAHLPADDWGYSVSKKTAEDCNHGSLDVAGVYRLYASGRYGIHVQQLTPIANTVRDVIPLGKQQYAGRLNGASGTGNSIGTHRLRSGYLFMALFKPEAYQHIMTDAGLNSGNSTNRIDVYSRFLWVKHERSTILLGEGSLARAISFIGMLQLDSR